MPFIEEIANYIGVSSNPIVPRPLPTSGVISWTLLG